MALGQSKSARAYRANPASRKKHSDDNNSGSGGKYAHSKAYKRKHWHARNKLKIRPDQDVEFKGGKAVATSRKKNRAKGGAQRA